MPRFSVVSLSPHALERIHGAATAIAFAVALAVTPAAVAAGFGNHSSNAFTIETLSTVPHLVTGGDVLVRVGVPRNVSVQGTQVTLNGVDVTSKFMVDSSSTRSLIGLVTGLRRGNNTIGAYARGRGGRGSSDRTLT